MHPAIQSLVKKVNSSYPFTFVDVGAMGGIAAKWDVLEDSMKIIAFEADEREFAKLKNTHRVTYLNYIVYGRKQDLKFYISRSAGKSSIFPPNKWEVAQFPEKERYDIVNEISFADNKVCTFDSLVENGTIKDLDFMKLDTEGSELSILEGARELLLPMIFGMQIEVGFIQKCQNQPLFRDIDELMDQEGYQLIDLKRQFWKRKNFNNYIGKGQLTFGDVLYFKKIDTFREYLSTNKLKGDFIKAKLYKAILSCMVYRVFDYAVAVADMAVEEKHINSQEHAEVLSSIKLYASHGVLPEFPGKEFLYKFFRKAAEETMPMSYRGWSDSDRHIGNIRDI